MIAKRIGVRAASAAALTAALVFSGGLVAQAAELPDSETTLASSAALVPAGFDSAVAEANGYKIVTDSTGEQRSVAVSPEAIEFERQLARTPSITPFTTFVSGPCGTSWINAVSRGNTKVISTGYVVPRPVIVKTWTVQVWGWGGLPSYTWGGSSGASWSSSWSFTLSGADFANVLPGSNVVMNNGTVCLSGSPGENFHS